jgi:hypothetical protein
MRKDPEARRCALAMLASGMMTLPEAAAHAGVSRHLVRHWAKVAGIDWKRVRSTRCAVWWQKEMRNGNRLVEIKKARAG